MAKKSGSFSHLLVSFFLIFLALPLYSESPNANALNWFNAPIENDGVEEQVEFEKFRNALIEKQNSASTSPLERRTQAENFFKKGMVLISKSDPTKALIELKAALVADASVDQYFVGYAIALSQLSENTKSICILRAVSAGEVSYAEVRFYLATALLNTDRLNEAKDDFTRSKEEKDDRFSIAATMYLGAIERRLGNTNLSKKYFQEVLTQTQDPVLAMKCKEAIKSLEEEEQLKQSQKAKFSIRADLGSQYDTNILNINTVTSGEKANGFRFNYAVELAYRFTYLTQNTITPTLGVSDLYSFDQKLKENSTLQAADPLVQSFNLPFVFMINNKVLAIQPGLLSLYMTNGSSRRIKILDTQIVNINWQQSLTEQTLARFLFQYANEVNVGADKDSLTDLSAKKSTLSFDIFHADAPRSQAGWGYLFSNQSHNAKTDSFKFQRLTAGLGRNLLFRNTSIISAKIALAKTDYPKDSAKRHDINYNLSFGFNAVKSGWNYELSYIKNQSTELLSTYDHWLVLINYTFKKAF